MTALHPAAERLQLAGSRVLCPESHAWEKGLGTSLDPQLGKPPVRASDIVVEAVTPADDHAAGAAIVRPYAEAGATWWIE